MNEGNLARGVREEELAVFTRQVGALLAAGVDILKALQAAAQHATHPQLRSVAQLLGDDMANGLEFSSALARYPEVFSAFYVQMARQGEADGILGPTLLRIAEHLHSTSLAAPRADDGAAPAPGAASPELVATPMLSLGIGAVGGAALWALASATRGQRWAGPLAVGWGGLCLVGGALTLLKGGRGAPAAPLEPRAAPLRIDNRGDAEVDAAVAAVLREVGEPDGGMILTPLPREESDGQLDL